MSESESGSETLPVRVTTNTFTTSGNVVADSISTNVLHWTDGTVQGSVFAQSVSIQNPTSNLFEDVSLRIDGPYVQGSPFELFGGEQVWHLNASSDLQADHLVARDSNGNFSANVVVASLDGNASTATKLNQPVSINGVSFDGSENITLPMTPIQDSTEAVPDTLVLRDGNGGFRVNVVEATVFEGRLHRAIDFLEANGNVVTFDNTENVTVSIGSGTGGASINASVDESGAPEYAGFVRTEGAFYGGNVDPSGNTRLNYDGDLHATTLVGSTIGLDATVETLTCAFATVGDSLTAQTCRCERVLGEEARFHASVASRAFETVSDRRLKTDVRPLERANETVRNWTGVTFRWKHGSDASEQVGLMAQDVQETCPQAVVQGEDGYLRVRYPNLVAVLVEAIKEQDARIRVLEDAMKRIGTSSNG